MAWTLVISRRRRSGFGASPLLVAALALGCTPLDPQSDTASNVQEVQGGGGGGGGGDASVSSGGVDNGVAGVPINWACLNSPAVPVDQPAQRVKYQVAIVDFDSQPYMATAVAGLKITVCGSPSCEPEYGPPDVVITNPDGLPPYVFVIEFPYNFSNGYLRLTAPNYAPMEYILGGPMKGPPEGGYVVAGQTIPLLKTSTRDTIYSDLGLSGADPTRGVLAVRTLDCKRNTQGPQGSRAAGVRLEAIPRAPQPPAVAWTLSFSNRATPNKLETDARGVAGFINVVPGTIDVEGIAPVGAKGTSYGATSLPVRAGVITLAEIRDGLERWGQ